MQIIADLFNTIFYGPIVNVLVLLLHFLESLNVPGALGISIILVTILIRLLVWPFMASQLKTTKKMAELKPHLDALKSKHKDDKQALAKAQMDLYKEHGVNPAGGCLPLLFQIPPMIAIYQVVNSFFRNPNLDAINHVLYNPAWHLTKVPDLSFFGLNLGDRPSDFLKLGSFPEFLTLIRGHWLIILIPIITAGFQLIQSRMMLPQAVKTYPKDTKKEKEEKESMEDAMASMQGQMMFLMPLMMGYITFTFPIGLALYLNTVSIVGIFQQYLISGWGGLATWFKFLAPKKD